MPLLTLLALFLLPLTAPPIQAFDFDQSSLFSASLSVTLIHPAPNIDFLYNQRGESATIYQQGPGSSWYSNQDGYRRIDSQGYLFEPNPRPAQIEVPRYTPQREVEMPGPTR